MGVSQGGAGLQERPGQVQVAEGSSAKSCPIRRLRIEGGPLPGSFLRGGCAAGCCLHASVSIHSSMHYTAVNPQDSCVDGDIL